MLQGFEEIRHFSKRPENIGILKQSGKLLETEI